MSQIFGAIGSLVGGIQGASSAQGDKNRADALMQDAIGNWNYNTQAGGQGTTEYDKMDPTSRDAMMRALTEYSSMAQQGGLDAKGRAKLAAGTQAAEQAAAQTAAQIQAQAARRGAAQGPATMVAQQVASQQAGERARQTGLDSAALAEEARFAALSGQTGAAGQIHGMDAQRAAAQDAINQFNVRNAQQNIQNQAQQMGGKTGAQEKAAGVYEGRAGRDFKEFQGMGESLGSNVGSIVGFGKDGGFGGMGGAQGISPGGGDESEGLSMGAWGR